MLLECRRCQALVNAELMGSYIRQDEHFGPVTYGLYRCPKCEHPLLTDEDEYFGVSRIYPPMDKWINPRLPAPIKAAYEEAVSCFKSKAYTAAAIMCRKTLEGICVEHGVTGRNLVSALKELKDKGIIESRLYEWADALGISGNEAAHDVNVRISKVDAKDILEFTNALLEYVFTFRDRFEEFKNRRSNKPST